MTGTDKTIVGARESDADATGGTIDTAGPQDCQTAVPQDRHTAGPHDRHVAVPQDRHGRSDRDRRCISESSDVQR